MQTPGAVHLDLKVKNQVDEMLKHFTQIAHLNRVSLLLLKSYVSIVRPKKNSTDTKKVKMALKRPKMTF